MKRIFLMAFSLQLLALSSFAQESFHSLALQSSLPMGTAKMKDVSGKEISLAEATQKNGLLVMFSCNTCPYVIRNQERTKEVCSYAKQNEVGVVIINSNEAQRDQADAYNAMQQYAKDQAYQWYYAVDKSSTVANAFGATRTPEVFLFDKNGTLLYKGAIDDNPSKADAVQHTYLKDAIDEMVAGKDVAVKESKSVGCTIKRTTM